MPLPRKFFRASAITAIVAVMTELRQLLIVNFKQCSSAHDVMLGCLYVGVFTTL